MIILHRIIGNFEDSFYSERSFLSERIVSIDKSCDANRANDAFILKKVVFYVFIYCLSIFHFVKYSFLLISHLSYVINSDCLFQLNLFSFFVFGWSIKFYVILAVFFTLSY
jgi:hypothetical protein